ncbi:ankyrin repeat-containing domain protein, partial [Russula aff. rugulosa BPL654]
GADLDVRGQYETIPLHAAAFSGNSEVVQILIGYDSANINARDGFGSTPVHLASGGRFFKDGSALRSLLEHGGDINAQDQGGSTPFNRWYTCASFNGRLPVVRLLLEHGADVEVMDKYGETVLQVASEEGHDEVVGLLREYGAK